MIRISLTIATFAVGLSLLAHAQTSPPVSAAGQSAAAKGPIFPKGQRAPAANFTGVVYVCKLPA